MVQCFHDFGILSIDFYLISSECVTLRNRVGGLRIEREILEGKIWVAQDIVGGISEAGLNDSWHSR